MMIVSESKNRALQLLHETNDEQLRRILQLEHEAKDLEDFCLQKSLESQREARVVELEWALRPLRAAEARRRAEEERREKSLWGRVAYFFRIAYAFVRILLGKRRN